jgi:hypothetical protein
LSLISSFVSGWPWSSCALINADKRSWCVEIFPSSSSSSTACYVKYTTKEHTLYHMYVNLKVETNRKMAWECKISWNSKYFRNNFVTRKWKKVNIIYLVSLPCACNS